MILKGMKELIEFNLFLKFQKHILIACSRSKPCENFRKKCRRIYISLEFCPTL